MRKKQIAHGRNEVEVEETEMQKRGEGDQGCRHDG